MFNHCLEAGSRSTQNSSVQRGLAAKTKKVTASVATRAVDLER